MPPKKKVAPQFNKAYCVEYGLKIMARDPASSAVTDVRCQFCAFCGREEAMPGGKRKRTSSIKYFRSFRAQYYKQHLEKQHPDEWTSYQALNKQEKETFFEGRQVIANTLHAHLDIGEDAFVFLVNRKIVDVVVGDLLFDPDDDDVEVSRERALALFNLQEDAADDDEAQDAYTVTIKSSRQFRVVVKFVACGTSFRLTSRLLTQIKDEAALGYLTGVSDVRVSQFVRVVVAANLQRISEILDKTWAFSIAVDAGHTAGTSYFDVRIRFCRDITVHNLHFLALPVRDRKTAQNLFDLVSAALDAVIPGWRQKLIGISTDGENTMTGRLNGLVTLFERAVDGDDLFRIWCALHQLDLVVQAAYQKLHNETFVGLLNGLIGYLRRQQNLIVEMGSTCPKLMLTRWAHMHRVLAWLVEHRVRVMLYLEQKKPACTPPLTWWIVVLGLVRVTAEVLEVVMGLQGFATLLSQQTQALVDLGKSLRELCPVEGPLSMEQMAEAESAETHVTSGSYAVKLGSARAFIEDLGSFVIQSMRALEEDDIEMLETSFAEMFVELVNGFDSVVAERDSNNNASLELLPAVTPQGLVRLRRSEFAAITIRFKARMRRNGIDEQSSERVENDFNDLLRAYRMEEPLKKSIDDKSQCSSFQESWSMVDGRFPDLQNFCGGIASIFPNTSRVEADFSTIKREKNDLRMALSDFSLEGILHAGQFNLLQTLK